jgi:hypothetical protein
MSRHVVLLRRDPSLGLALRALLHGTGRVTEVQNIQAWSAMPAEGIDAVVIDLPPSRRKQAIDLVRSRFGGRLVLVLDPHDDPSAVPTNHAYAMVQRPFEIVELWHLVTTDPSGSGRVGSRAAELGGQVGPGSSDDLDGFGSPGGPEREETGRPAVGAGVAAASGADRGPEGRGDPAGTVQEGDDPAPAARGAADPVPAAGAAAGGAPGEAPGPGRAAADASTWKWRGRRYGPATAIPPGPSGGEPRSGAPPGPRTGAPGPARPSGPTAGPSAGGASESQPAPDEAERRQSESRRWGALPRRSAEPQPGPRPSEAPTGPRDPAAGSSEAAIPTAARAADRGAADATDPRRPQPADTPAGPEPSRRADAEPGPRPSRPEAGSGAGSPAKRRVTRPTRPPAGRAGPRRRIAPTGPDPAEGSAKRPGLGG